MLACVTNSLCLVRVSYKAEMEEITQEADMQKIIPGTDSA